MTEISTSESAAGNAPARPKTARATTDIDRLSGRLLRSLRSNAGLSQTAMARAAGLSPTYVNLLESGRRPMGATARRTLAAVLGTEPGALDGSALNALRQKLQALAADDEQLTRTLEDFAISFPDWAGRCVAQHERMSRTETLSDELMLSASGGPEITATMHDLLSRITAIRSMTSLIAGDDAMPSAVRRQFTESLDEESRQLAAGAEELLARLSADTDITDDARTVADLMAAQDWLIPALEDQPHSWRDYAQAAFGEAPEPYRGQAQEFLKDYADAAAALSFNDAYSLSPEEQAAPFRLTNRFSFSHQLALLRTALLPTDLLGGRRYGFAIADGTGFVRLQRELPDFALPASGRLCPRWLLFSALQQPGVALRERFSLPGDQQFMAFAIGYETEAPDGDRRAIMIWRRAERSDGRGRASDFTEAGVQCITCPLEDCAQRQEARLR